MVRRFKMPRVSVTRIRKVSRAVSTILKGLTAVSAAFSPIPVSTKVKSRSKPSKPKVVKGKVSPKARGSAQPGRKDVVGSGVFTEHRFTNTYGSREYKLYRPPATSAKPLPLLIMLHGCTQSPDDFAAGTRMNRWAEKLGFFVAYPAQSTSANASKCWNWFNVGDQKRGAGEPSLISGITAEIINNQPIDRARVYVAGLSAGGALAAVMSESYPELYAAVGIHSGVACGLATSMISAYSAMTKGATPRPRRKSSPIGRPLIVFQGDHDRTVHPSNADVIIARRGLEDGMLASQSTGKAGRLEYTKTLYHDRSSKTVLESWRIHGGGHVWFGGSPAGSYATSSGPDASREMVRFFLQHTL